MSTLGEHLKDNEHEIYVHKCTIPALLNSLDDGEQVLASYLEAYHESDGAYRQASWMLLGSKVVRYEVTKETITINTYARDQMTVVERRFKIVSDFGSHYPQLSEVVLITGSGQTITVKRPDRSGGGDVRQYESFFGMLK